MELGSAPARVSLFKNGAARHLLATRCWLLATFRIVYHPPVRIAFLALVVLVPMALACCGAPPSERQPPTARRIEPAMNLPKSAGAWTRPDSPRRVDAANIFDYMDGGGELYLAYRFDHLDVYQYAAAGRDPILVELYWMRTSDDAFGLLSNDWGGEAVALQDGPGARPPTPDTGVSPIPTARALYGAGLLRLWSDTLYARVLAGRETPESRDQVIALGRAIVAGRALATRPALLDSLPDRVGDPFRILGGRACFLRSHLVLNSAYFLASKDILDLSLDAEAVIAPYDAGSSRVAGSAGGRPYLLVVRYADPITARRAFDHFAGAYLPDARIVGPVEGRVNGTHRTEHGWVGFRLKADRLALALDAPDEASANKFVNAVGK